MKTVTLTGVPFVVSGLSPGLSATCDQVALPLIGAVKTNVLFKIFVCVSILTGPEFGPDPDQGQGLELL